MRAGYLLLLCHTAITFSPTLNSLDRGPLEGDSLLNHNIPFNKTYT